MLPTAVKSMWPLASALPISRIALILGAERPSRLSLSVRAWRTRVVVERLESGEQPLADRGGARGRQLLPADDGAEAGKARLAPAQAEGAGLVGDRREARVGEDQLG